MDQTNPQIANEDDKEEKASHRKNAATSNYFEQLPVDENVTLDCKVEVFSLTAIDTQHNNFTAAMYIQIRSDELNVATMDSLAVEVINLQSTDRQQSYTSKEADGTVEKHLIIYGVWTAHFDLKAFPADVQTMEVRLECWNYKINKAYRLNPMNLSLVKGFAINEVFELCSKINEAVNDDMQGVPNYQMSFYVRRRSSFYLLNYAAPVGVIASLSWVVLGVPREDVADRLSLVLTLLLTVVAYKIVLNSGLPVTSKPCNMDYFLYASYILILLIVLLCCVATLIDDSLNHNGEGVAPSNIIIACLSVPWVGYNLLFLRKMVQLKRQARIKYGDERLD